MFSRLTDRRRPAERRRPVMALIAVLSLNMAVLPCSMAFQDADDCPHCPPAADHAMAMHHGHGEERAEAPGQHRQSDCCDPEEASVDARGGKPDIKPASAAVFAAGPAPCDTLSGRGPAEYTASDPPRLAGAAPPLHVLYCVFLD